VRIARGLQTICPDQLRRHVAKTIRAPRSKQPHFAPPICRLATAARSINHRCHSPAPQRPTRELQFVVGSLTGSKLSLPGCATAVNAGEPQCVNARSIQPSLSKSRNRTPTRARHGRRPWLMRGEFPSRGFHITVGAPRPRGRNQIHGASLLNPCQQRQNLGLFPATQDRATSLNVPSPLLRNIKFAPATWHHAPAGDFLGSNSRIAL